MAPPQAERGRARGLRPPRERAPWGPHAGGPTRLPAPAVPAGPRSRKGVSTFFLCSSPAPEASVHPSAHSGAAASALVSVRARGTGGPGSWRQIPVPSLYPFVRGGRATHSQPPGPGAGPRPSFLFPAAAPGPVRLGRGPAISQAGPRGMCRFILLWRTGGPKIRPFLLFVFYFEIVFNAFI